MSSPRIIILGAGLGGTVAAYEIRDVVKGKADVMVVNDQEDDWFVPSNPSVAGRSVPTAEQCHDREYSPMIDNAIQAARTQFK